MDFEANVIFQLLQLTSISGVSDSYCYHFENKGVYIIKSAYRLGIDELSRYNPSPSNPFYDSMVEWFVGCNYPA